jgi:hypothetical protein
LFAGEFSYELDEFSLLLIIGCLAFEDRRDMKIYKTFPHGIAKLISAINSHPYLKRDSRFKMMEILTGLIRPCVEGKKFIEILDNTNMIEGDLIRFYMQILDKLEQIDRAMTHGDIKDIVKNCKKIIKGSLEGIHIF